MDTEVAGTVIEDAHELKISIEQLRNAVFDKLRDEEVPDDLWRSFLKSFFFRHAHNYDGNAYIYESDFHDLLLDLKLYKSPKAFDILWQAIDYDLSGTVDWDEIEELFWPPELTAVEDPVVSTIRVQMQTLLTKRKLPLEEWEPAVKELFVAFDIGKSIRESVRMNFLPIITPKNTDKSKYLTLISPHLCLNI